MYRPRHKHNPQVRMNRYTPLPLPAEGAAEGAAEGKKDEGAKDQDGSDSKG